MSVCGRDQLALGLFPERESEHRSEHVGGGPRSPSVRSGFSLSLSLHAADVKTLFFSNFTSTTFILEGRE